MYEAPHIQEPREVFDSAGTPLGTTDGFRPDPGTGGLGLEVELTSPTRAFFNVPAWTVWIPQRWVAAVRRDSIRLDRTRHEVRALLPLLDGPPAQAERETVRP